MTNTSPKATVTSPAIPAVWTRYGLDELAIVGIWLGTHDDGNDTINGRFYPLPEALQNSAWPQTRCGHTPKRTVAQAYQSEAAHDTPSQRPARWSHPSRARAQR
jgi:hypothetical protein